jgi:RND family efflux transporter MFP subunit
MKKSSKLYSDHIYPYGLGSKNLLERQSFDAENNKLTSPEETDKFNKKQNVETTLKTFIESGRGSSVTLPCSLKATVTCHFSPKKTISSIFMACLSIFLLAGCTDNHDQSISNSSQDDSEQTRERPSKQVSVMTIELKTVAMTNELPGRVKAFKTAEIRPQLSGIIQARFFKEGSLVEKGQQLYQIDAAIYEANYQSAKANLQYTVAELDIADALQNRYQSLIKTNAVSEQEFDNVKASLAQAKALVALAKSEVKTAKTNLDYTKVYAPISGYIGPSAFTQGALVTAQQQAALATIWQLDPVYVDISQSIAEAQPLQEKLMTSRMTQEADAQFEVTVLLGENGNIYPQKGVLYATDLAVDENTGTVRLRSVFPNPDSILLPGMFVRATIAVPKSQKIISVPQKAVSIKTDGSKVVWIVDNNHFVSKREVITSTTYENNWVISSGLKSGDKIVIDGKMMLQSGVKVDPINIKQPQSKLTEEASSRSIRTNEPASKNTSSNESGGD